MFKQHRLKILFVGLVAIAGVTVYQTVGLTTDRTNMSASNQSTSSASADSGEQSAPEKPVIRVETRSYTSVKRLDEALEKTDFVRSTEHGTQFIVVQEFPDDFGTIRSADRKKRIFREVLLPQIRLENRRLLKERARVKSFVEDFSDSASLSDTRQRRIRTLLARYEVVDGDRHNWEITESDLDTLLRRIHVIPPSLVLAQAANESAWGTSRFCLEANNIFGEWTYDKSEGLKPKGVDESAPHRVKIFPDIRSSLRSYMLNLNTHSAYEPFRELRVEHSDTMNSLKLVKGLKKYSSQRGKYVDFISDLIRYNDYRQYDRF